MGDVNIVDGDNGVMVSDGALNIVPDMGFGGHPGFGGGMPVVDGHPGFGVNVVDGHPGCGGVMVSDGGVNVVDGSYGGGVQIDDGGVNVVGGPNPLARSGATEPPEESEEAEEEKEEEE